MSGVVDDINSNRPDVPHLDAEDLQNPFTIVVVEGITVRLWQVAHLYGLRHPVPSPKSRYGATSEDVRGLYRRDKGREAAEPARIVEEDEGDMSNGREIGEVASLRRDDQQHCICESSPANPSGSLTRKLEELSHMSWPPVGEKRAKAMQSERVLKT
jgi:hypothetical protein